MEGKGEGGGWRGRWGGGVKTGVVLSGRLRVRGAVGGRRNGAIVFLKTPILGSIIWKTAAELNEAQTAYFYGMLISHQPVCLLHE